MAPWRRLMLVVVLSVLASPAHADGCCYSACRDRHTLVILVTCAAEETGCPRTVGTCGVFAEKEKGIDCDEPSTCDPGAYGDEAAELLVQRLAADDGVVVTRSVSFGLRSGQRVTFEP